MCSCIKGSFRTLLRAEASGICGAVKDSGVSDETRSFQMNTACFGSGFASGSSIDPWRRRGQSTIEAAVTIPVIFLLLLLLLQPGIYLYDRVVMMGAAAEGCRLLATSEEVSGAGDEGCEQAIRRRLGAIPSQELFHVHEGECSYQIGLEGSEATERVQVTIENKLRPLPILDMGATLLGLTDSEGCLTCKVQVSLPTQDEWVAQGSLGLNPSGWANAREGTS